jgi:pfkB family carbohydrate kinase
VIVVIGIPAWRAAAPAAPAGRACEIAVSAARRGARVELVGRTGDDAAGDALLLALSQAGVGHVAMLRDPARSTPVVALAPDADPAAGPASLGDRAGDLHPAGGSSVTPTPRLEAADVALGLQYLTTFEVVVVADGVPEAAIPVAVDAAGFADAHLIVLVPAGSAVPALLPATTTVLAAPDEADDGAFAALVGAYAAALDGGATPAAAFAAATGDAGWEALEPGA